MKRKFITFILVLSMAVPFGIPFEVKAETTVDEEGHVLTDIVKTEEDLEWERENIIFDEDLELNELGKERVLEDSISNEGSIKRLSKAKVSTNSIASTTAAQSTTLPSAVDNSTLSAFPGIGDQGTFGSCTSFASTYYNMTHVVNLITGRSGKDLNNVFSPKWTYNAVNNGDYTKGSSIGSNFAIISSVGALSWSDFPYSSDTTNPSNYREWENSFTSALKAQRYSTGVMHGITVGGTGAYITNNKDSDLTAIKTALSNGYLLNFDTRMDELKFTTVKNDTSTSVDNAYVGQQICEWRNGTQGSNHALTVVGYNDNLWTDINGDGVVQAAEKGALKIANSWGTDYKNDGFFWIAYDALNGVSQVQNLPAECSKHRQFSDGGSYIWIEPEIKDSVKTYAKFTLRGAYRNQVKVVITATNKTTGSSYSYYSALLNNNGGEFNFNGESGECYGYFVVDLDKVKYGITPSEIKDYNWTLKVTDNKADGNPTKVVLYQIVDEVNNRTYSNAAYPSGVDKSTIELINSPIIINSYTGTNSNAAPNNTVKGVGKVGQALRFNATASGGNSALKYQYNITCRSPRPEINSAESSVGSYTWTPTEAGIYSVNVIAKDTSGNTQRETLYYTITQ